MNGIYLIPLGSGNDVIPNGATFSNIPYVLDSNDNFSQINLPNLNGTFNIEYILLDNEFNNINSQDFVIQLLES